MPTEVVEDRFSGPSWEQSIYRSETLDDEFGSAPEQTLVNHLSPALSDIGINHVIRYDFSPVPVNSDDNRCPQNAPPDVQVSYEEWAQYLDGGGVPFLAKDSNLLMNMSGGGCASKGGNVAVAPGRFIDGVYNRFFSWESGPNWQTNVYASMHEIGHNMGWGHDPHPGLTYNALNAWNRTPCVGSTTATSNLCDGVIEPESAPNRHNLLYYHDCVAEHIQIQEPPDTGTVEIVQLTLSPSVAEVGDTVSIHATMANTTSSNVQRDEPVLVGDDQIDTLHFDVGPGETQTRSTSFVPTTTGEFLVQVNQGTATLVVEEETIPPGQLEVLDVSVSPSPPVVGDGATISVVVQNDSESPVQETVAVKVDGSTVGNVSFDLPGRGINRPPPEDTGTVSWTPVSAGTSTVSAGSVSTTVTVEAEPPGNGGGGEPPVEPTNPIPAVALAGGAALLFFLARPERGSR